MSHSQGVLEKIQKVEQKLDELEDIVARYRREILSLVEDIAKNTDQLVNEKLEEERKRLSEEAKKRAEAESNKIRLEYESRINQIKRMLGEKREKIVDDVVSLLLGL
jgi:Skp family chaperone for outer membrane proteins